jgi:hypothetical protein
MLVLAILVSSNLKAERLFLSLSDSDFELSNVYSDVDLFVIDIELEIPLEPGLYNNPQIINVDYRVFGNLVAGTPSGFSSFDLQRSLSGEEFYQQGSSLVFQIADSADFSDGIQGNELVDIGYLLTLNAREIDNRRFHPAILELYADGTGSIQNSNNIHTLDPLLEVNFGDEYITDLVFEPANLTMLRQVVIEEPESTSGGGVIGTMATATLLFLFLCRLINRLLFSRLINPN